MAPAIAAANAEKSLVDKKSKNITLIASQILPVTVKMHLFTHG
jgi:hypothetical protein